MFDVRNRGVASQFHSEVDQRASQWLLVGYEPM